MKKYETYQSDQFAGRDAWIEVSTGMEYLLGRRDSGGVFKGEDHYLLEKIESDEGDNVQDNIEAVRSFAEKNQEREIYFLVAPNAAEILQDKLPAFAVTEDQKGQLERLRASLPEQIRWIDACGALEAHRDEEIYYRTDHHWTSLGAWYAFQEAKKVMALNEAYTEKLTPRAVSDSFNGTLSARSGYERGFREPIYIYFPDGTEGTQAVVYDVEKGEKTASLYAPEKLKEKDQYAVFLGGNRAASGYPDNLGITGKAADIQGFLRELPDSLSGSLLPSDPGGGSQILLWRCGGFDPGKSDRQHFVSV